MAGSLAGKGKAQANQQPAISGLQIQSSAYGKCVPLVYGTARLAPNLGWYGDFTATAQQSSAGAGKGGVGGGGGGKGGGGSTSYVYQAAFTMMLCEGPITTVAAVYADKNVTDLAGVGMTLFTGGYRQTPWGFLQAYHPTQALTYSGFAYVAAPAYQLGNSAQLPNHNFEVSGFFSSSLSGIGLSDADPSLVVADLLTNPIYGAGFPSGRLGDLSSYQAYCIATGLWISPAYTDQAASAQMLQEIATNTNSDWVWSSGVLTLVPYGDQTVSNHGYTYTAPAAPEYDLTDDDFMPNQGSNGSDPVQLVRKRPSDALNSIRLEYLDRNNQYNPAIVEAKDQASIDTFGLRQDPSRQAHMFADGNAAQISAQLQLQRQAIRNTYQFTLDERFIRLDPMDIVSLTDPNLGLNRQWVRITEISENDDGSLNFIAEEYLQGTGTSAIYSFQTGLGFTVNYNSDPGNANAPVIFEPPAELDEALEVWMAVSGPENWGGCDVWISGDDQQYRLAGRINGGARTGVLTQPLPTVMDAATGQTIDPTNTLAVDLSQSRGQLLSGTRADATSLATLSYVDGELVAFENATLTGANAYDLQWLVRGAYGSPIGPHAAGSPFARLDGGLFIYPFTQERIGQTIYIKLLSFNIYGGGEQQLSEVTPYAYTLKGAALSSPLPDVGHLRSSYVASITQLTWDEVTDFRPVLYEIRQGDNWTGAQYLGRVAHPPFNVQGNGKYWVSAFSQPLAGLQVYSETPMSLLVVGAQITSNVVASYDEAATGWSGTVLGSAGVAGSDVVTAGSGNILTLADFLAEPDILHYGGTGDGTYEIPSAHEIDIGRVAPCSILISWTAQGQHITDNILSLGDFLGQPDILDYQATANIDVYPEIALSRDGITFGAWQRYAAGTYIARKFKARVQLLTYDPTVEAILSAFVFAVDVPDRDDHYTGLSIASGGLTLTYLPDGSATPAAFNGGPGGSSAPNVQVTILNASDGDTLKLTSATLSGCTLQVVNGGVGVTRDGNVLVQGY